MNGPRPGGQLGNAAEAVVVALAIAGSQPAFTELVRRRHSWLRSLLRHLSRDPALADDLAQQVLLRAWSALPTLKSSGAFAAWLRRLAINTWLQQRRRRGDSLSLELEQLPDTSPLGAVGVRMDLDAALATLPPAVRLCVVLSYCEGMSHGEISSAAELPIGTVKSHIRRGAERLRTLLQAYGPQDEHP